MKRDELDDILREKLHDMESIVDAPSWGEFESRRSPKPHTRTLWYSIGSAAAAAVVAVTVWVITPTNTTITIDQTYTQQLQPQNIEPIGQTLDTTHLEPTNIDKRVFYIPLPVDSFTDDFDSPSQEHDREIHTAVRDDMYDDDDSGEEPEIPGRVQDEAKVYVHDLIRKEEELSAGVDNKRSIAMAAYTGIISTNSSKSLQNSSSIAPQLMSIQAGNSQKVWEFIDGELKHKMPISAGLSVSIPLNKSFSLQTGVNYTYLESARTGHNFAYTQQVHYVGIPLAVSYKIINTKVLDFYVMAGTMAEVIASAKGTSELRIGTPLLIKTTIDIETNGLQMSTNLGVGINLHITKNFGFYVEPGIAHYFTNSNQPVTSRSKSDIQFNLRTGFRFQL